MSHYSYITPLYLLHQAHAAIAWTIRQSSQVSCAGLVTLFHQYRRAFNATAANGFDSVYYDNIQPRP